MYGQTNCWVQPEMEYIVFRVKSGDLFLCTKRAALNMAYQEFTEEFGKYEPLLTVTGKVSIWNHEEILNQVYLFPFALFPFSSLLIPPLWTRTSWDCRWKLPSPPTTLSTPFPCLQSKMAKVRGHAQARTLGEFGGFGRTAHSLVKVRGGVCVCMAFGHLAWP